MYNRPYVYRRISEMETRNERKKEEKKKREPALKPVGLDCIYSEKIHFLSRICKIFSIPRANVSSFLILVLCNDTRQTFCHQKWMSKLVKYTIFVHPRKFREGLFFFKQSFPPLFFFFCASRKFYGNDEVRSAIYENLPIYPNNDPSFEIARQKSSRIAKKQMV